MTEEERAGIREGAQYFQVSRVCSVRPQPQYRFYSVYLPRVPAEMPIRRDSLPRNSIRKRHKPRCRCDARNEACPDHRSLIINPSWHPRFSLSIALEVRRTLACPSCSAARIPPGVTVLPVKGCCHPSPQAGPVFLLLLVRRLRSYQPRFELLELIPAGAALLGITPRDRDHPHVWDTSVKCLEWWCDP